MSSSSNGHRQVVRVYPAVESERIHGTAGKPLLCHVKGYYDRDQGKPFTLATLPVSFDDQGHPSDVAWTPREAVWVTRLDFTFRGKAFFYPIGPMLLRRGQPLRLALWHLKLLDRFGLDLLGR